MLTIFCSPKPFVREASLNQLRALRSWRAIDPKIEIVVFGDVAGAGAAAVEAGAIHVRDLAQSETGAPSFNGMVEYLRTNAAFDLQVYVNADILLNKSILEAMERASRRFREFLMIGERLDLAENGSLDPNQGDFIRQARALAQTGGLKVHGPNGVDYFGFPRGMWKGLGPVFMGRAMCDQALIHHCLRNHLPVIDATLQLAAVHQFHDYNHVQGGFQEVFLGKDRGTMARAHRLNHSLPTITDADWCMKGGSIVPGTRQKILRRAELWTRYHAGLDRPALGFRLLQRLGGNKGVTPRLLSLDSILEAWENNGSTSPEPVHVALVAHRFPHYRSAILQRLLASTKFKFFLYADVQGEPGSGIPACNLDGCDRFIKTKVHYFPRHLTYQEGMLRLALRRDIAAIIYPGAAQFISVWVGAALARLAGKRVLFWTHGWTRDERGVKDALRSLFYRIAHGLLLYGRRAKKLGAARGFDDRTMHVIYNSLDHTLQTTIRRSLESNRLSGRRKQLLGCEPRPLLIYSGRLRAVKRVDMILAAMRLLQAKGHPVSLLVIGEGEERERLERYAATNALSTLFVGECYDEHMLGEFFMMSDLLVSPGNIGLAAIHSLTYGTPVLTHDDVQAQMPEVEVIVPGLNGDTFKKGNIDDLASKIRAWTMEVPLTMQRRRTIWESVLPYYTPQYQAEAIEHVLESELQSLTQPSGEASTLIQHAYALPGNRQECQEYDFRH